MELAEEVGAEGVAGSYGVNDVDLSGGDVHSFFVSEDGYAVGSSGDEDDLVVFGPLLGDFVNVSLVLVEPLDVFVTRFDDVGELVGSFDSFSFFLGVEAEGGADVDVVGNCYLG